MNYHKIEKTSVANGTGVRVVLWVSGCTCYCKNCQNPQTWPFDSGKLFDESAKQELFEALDKSYIDGITFSGGHPLEDENTFEVYNLIVEIKEKFPEKSIWLYTGLTVESIFNNFNPLSCRDLEKQKIVLNCDVVVDGLYIEELKDITLKWRGSSNQRVIDIKKTLQNNEIILFD